MSSYGTERGFIPRRRQGRMKNRKARHHGAAAGVAKVTANRKHARIPARRSRGDEAVHLAKRETWSNTWWLLHGGVLRASRGGRQARTAGVAYVFKKFGV